MGLCVHRMGKQAKGALAVGSMAIERIVNQCRNTLPIALTGQPLKGAHTNMAGGDAGQNAAGFPPGLPQHLLTGAHST